MSMQFILFSIFGILLIYNIRLNLKGFKFTILTYTLVLFLFTLDCYQINAFEKSISNESKYISLIILLFVIIQENSIIIKSIIQDKKEKIGTDNLVNKIYIDNDSIQNDFISNLSYELQAPLESIVGLSEIIQRNNGLELSERSLENIKLINLTAIRTNKLIQNIIDFSKSLKEEITLTSVSINLKEFLLKIIEKNKLINNKINSNIINKIPVNIIIIADPVRLEQILEILIINIFKANSIQNIFIETLYLKNSEELIQINIFDSVSDNNIKEMNGVYNSLESLKNFSIKYDSHKMSLSLAKKLIELHGGELWNDPEINYKNSVSFTIPLAKSKLDIERVLIEGNPFVNYGNNSTTHTILAIDDEPINLLILKKHLMGNNYQVISSTNSYEALDKIENEIIPDLVLIDSNMPDLNGFELTKIIRKRYSLFQLPIIIISNTSFEDERNLAFGAGANDIITKPYNSTELISRINTYITLKYSIQDNQKHLMLENELSMARKLQLKMLPHKKPFLKDIKIVTLYLPMTYLAGDFYDYYEDSNGLGVLIADVTGHGIPSAMVTAMLKASFRILQKNISDPSLIMKGLNEILYGNDNQLLTAVYIYIDIKNKILLSSNAGHPSILLLKKSRELIEIKSKGRLIGFSLSENWELSSTKIESGDRIVLYTDGITETKNYNGEQFGEERLKQIIKDYSYLNNSDMIEATKRTLLDYSFQVNQEDDLTLMVIDILS